MALADKMVVNISAIQAEILAVLFLHEKMEKPAVSIIFTACQC